MKRLHALLLTTALLAGAGAALPVLAARQNDTLHEERSLYRNIFVTQDGDERCLLFRARRGLGRESCKLMSNPDRLVFEYAQMMLSGLYANPSPKRILVIGLGGATLPSALQELVPDAKMDVVELDSAVDRVSRKYFDFKPTANTKVRIEDGRVFVKRAGRAKQTYDLIMLDAFESDYIPEHMLTREFLQEVKAIMAPKGVLVANTWSSSGLYDHESATYQSVFGDFFNMKLDNRVILIRDGGLPDPAELRANAQKFETEFVRRGTGLATLLPMMRVRKDWDAASRILTDQYSPSNVLNAQKRGG
ncbi:MAG TPA: fused MFS/spermidine synthase [Caulobacteraceae bacterium]|jgi:spermidine synthase|nr:fused MFS/spermidine synthase [Caulobacteraceae bacterium]